MTACDDRRKGWRRLLGRWGRRLARPVLLSIEPTNRCNLNCPFCLVGLQNVTASTAHSDLPRPLGQMEMGLYRKILADAAEFGIRSLQLHFQGEPLMHRHLPEMIRMASGGGFPVTIFTNGMLLTAERAAALLDAGIACVRFSVDGATPPTYAANRVGGDFATVLGNMKGIADLARARGAKPQLIWQFIAMRNNEHEIADARRLAAEIGVDFEVKRFAVSVPDLVPRDPGLRRRLLLKPCRDIHRAIFVYWDGGVVPCCYDQAGENVLGNLGQQTLTQIWDGRVARVLRRRIDRAVARPDREPAMCRRCLKWGHHPWETSDGLVRWEPVEDGGEQQDDA